VNPQGLLLFQRVMSAVVILLVIFVGWMCVELRCGNSLARWTILPLLIALVRLFRIWSQIKFKK
jgi:hypothetical protein